MIGRVSLKDSKYKGWLKHFIAVFFYRSINNRPVNQVCADLLSIYVFSRTVFI